MKAANLLSHADNPKNLYLVDFGLAVKYMKVADSQKALIMLIDNVYILQGRRKCAQGRETGSAEGSRWHYRVLEQVDCCDLSQKYKTVFRDAHLGCTARRSDLENLALNLVHWSLGSLPWQSLVSKTMKPADLVKVQAAKIEFFDNLPSTGKGLSKQVVSPQYMVMVFNLFIIYLLLYQQKKSDRGRLLQLRLS